MGHMVPKQQELSLLNRPGYTDQDSEEDTGTHQEDTGTHQDTGMCGTGGGANKGEWGRQVVIGCRKFYTF